MRERDKCSYLSPFSSPSPFYGEGFTLKGFPSILHFVLRLSVEGRSSGSKDTLKGTEGVRSYPDSL